MSQVRVLHLEIMTSDNKIFLLPGELTIAQNNQKVWTVLGSCVSIILHSQRARISAVNHAQMPAEGGGISCKRDCPHPCGQAEVPEHKYVTCSIDFMWHRLKEMGIKRHELQVSLFGGATSPVFQGSRFSVGDKNIAAAELAISALGLQIGQRDVGGSQSRKLLHFSDTGMTRLL